MTQRNEQQIEVRIDSDLADLIPGYLENRRKDVSDIWVALELEDYETIRVLGHGMKGSGGGYGFEAITELGRALEQAAKNRELKTIKKQAVDLLYYLDHLQLIYE
ncbi:MAG: Hpt domain-containing protein [Desulfobacterales bacterium]|jgi:HPt (histidine-containing phosphotransfer) domain-containing protein|nr:Hpt domain-containing protein [Desulfobacterales bacterium]